MQAVAHFTPGSEGLLTPLYPWLKDKDVSEILINRPEEVFIERCGRMEAHRIPCLTLRHLKRLFTFIANENQQTLDEQNPLLSASLYDGARVQLVIPPAAKYPTLSIRRPSLQKRTLEDYANSNFYQPCQAFDLNQAQDAFLSQEDKELVQLYHKGQWAAFIKTAVQFKKNIVISGETSSGKTTYLNACAAHIPADERIITLEDTYEMDIPHQNRVAMLASKGLQAKDSLLCMQDLVQCSLRLRPDRLIMGEIRGKEIIDFISACSTGHEGSLTTIHAANPGLAFMRMVQLYKLNPCMMRDDEIKHLLTTIIDIIIQVVRKKEGRQASWIYYKHAFKHPKG